MKSIRQLTMTSDKDDKPKKTEEYSGYSGTQYRKDVYDPYDPYGYGQREIDFNKSYKPKQEGVITINTSVSFNSIGDYAQEYNPNFDELKAENKATEIIYDQMEKLLKENYLEDYSISFGTTWGYDEIEVTVTLTPTK